MPYFSTWGETFAASFQNVWMRFAAFIPNVLGAILILALGWVLATALSRIAKKLLELAHVDRLTASSGVTNELSRAGMTFTLSGLIATIVKWFFLIVTLIAVSDILRIPQVTNFLEDVARYIPNVIVAVIILTVGLMLGNFVQGLVSRAESVSKLTSGSAELVASVAKWSVVVFSGMAALVQLGVAASLIQILFTGLVAMVSLGGAIAFGLGAKDKASKLLEDVGSGMQTLQRR